MAKSTGLIRQVFFNGCLVPEHEAKISIYDSALMFGDMVFEMTRSYGGKQFKLKEHIDRLYTGLKILRIPLTMTPFEMEKACYETMEANQHLFLEDDEHRLMIDVTRGLLGIYQNIEGAEPGPNVLIADFPLRWTVSKMSILFKEGINCVITNQRVIPSDLMDPKIKNRSRLFYLMANIEASAYKGSNNWALMLDTDGFIAEGTGCNFFIVKDGVIITPEGRNILRGISREYVMRELCVELSIPCIEKNIEAFDVYTADEAFVTGTPFSMLPVTSLSGVQIGNGEVGPVFKTLLKQWSSNVGTDIEGQIESWDSDHMVSCAQDAPTPYSFKSPSTS